MKLNWKYIIGGLLIAGVLFYLWKKKQAKKNTEPTNVDSEITHPVVIDNGEEVQDGFEVVNDVVYGEHIEQEPIILVQNAPVSNINWNDENINRELTASVMKVSNSY